MCAKEKRTITIPANMAYGMDLTLHCLKSSENVLIGSRGAGASIPPSSALVFDVELVGLFAKGREEL